MRKVRARRSQKRAALRAARSIFCRTMIIQEKRKFE
jgi:hypothetical protein